MTLVLNYLILKISFY